MSSSQAPSLKAFYEGLYYSPIYSEHHRVSCNVGFHPLRALPCSSSSEERRRDPQAQDAAAVVDKLRDDARQFHAEHTPGDRYQLQLYQELVTMVPLTQLFPLATGERDHELFLRRFKVLDIGCGPGGGVCALKSVFPLAEITGVDISSQAIVRSKENWLQFAKHVPSLQDRHAASAAPRWLNQSCERMHSIRTASIDIATAVQCLQEVQDVTAAASELERVVKPGGVLFIADFIPHENARDRIYHELVELVTSPATAATSGWVLEQERLVTFNSALAAKLNSESTAKLIRECIPEEFRPDLETLFFVEHSALYERLQQSEMGYRLVCLRRKGTLEPINPFSATLANGYEELGDADFNNGEHEDAEEDEEEEEIDDDDLPNYYSYKDVYPQLELLKDNYHTILEEMQAVQTGASWPFWPEKHYTEGDSEWRVFPFCYTFPAFDASKTTWVKQTCGLCPRTVEVLKRIPNLRTALFSKLGPNTILGAHRGWADLSNHILRCHLGLVVPTLANGKPCCSMVVGGEAKDHEEGQVMVFDDSKLHYAYNHHPDATRLVLIVDLYRPDDLPRGRATGGHTDELDEFIQSFGLQALDHGGESDHEGPAKESETRS